MMRKSLGSLASTITKSPSRRMGCDALAYAAIREGRRETIAEVNRAALLTRALERCQPIGRAPGRILHDAVKPKMQHIAKLVAICHQVEVPVGILDVIGIERSVAHLLTTTARPVQKPNLPAVADRGLQPAQQIATITIINRWGQVRAQGRATLPAD